jgi:hypothetical protein
MDMRFGAAQKSGHRMQPNNTDCLPCLSTLREQKSGLAKRNLPYAHIF